MARKRYSEFREARRFGAIAAVILGAFGGWSLYRMHPVRGAVGLGAAVAVTACFLAAPAAWLRLFRLWMKLAEALSWVMTRVILSVFFYLVLAPVGIALRLLRKNPLDLAWKDGRPSYWVDKPEGDDSLERYGKMY